MSIQPTAVQRAARALRKSDLQNLDGLHAVRVDRGRSKREKGNQQCQPLDLAAVLLAG